MKTRFWALSLALLLILSLCAETASATSARASLTLSIHSAQASTGNKEGEVKFTYDVQTSQAADQVGVSSIKVYKSNGDYVTTVYGTTGNGLIRTNTNRHSSTYTYKGTSGQYYYAVVTVFATVGSNSDSREITTNSAQAR